LAKLAAELGIADSVQFMADYVPKDRVVDELLGCTALLAVSRYEGFSLPPLEAMSIGCAVILSDIPVHRAVYADPDRVRVAGGEPTFVQLDNPLVLADEMRRHLEDKAQLQEKARRSIYYARTFTQESTAAGLLRALRAVAHS
jgi:glycosyltransferase involved in cell wall biosynthesis